MYLSELSLTGFRNLIGDTFRPAPGINILYGDNGSGKTNLLEAIFLLCLGRSQRGVADSIMIADKDSHYRLEGTMVTGEKTYELAIACQRNGKKKIMLDKVSSKLAELYDLFCVVSIGPEDSEILSGAPAARRYFLDIYLSQYSKKYLRNLSDYRHALQQKNAALKSGHDPYPFNALLVEYGSPIIEARMSFLSSTGEVAAALYAEIAKNGALDIKYKPSVPSSPDDDVKSIGVKFDEKLSENEERERVMQVSMVGPHRDEVQFQIGGYPARSHASQGEWRTAAVALKLAVFRLLEEQRRSSPILLLDEVFAELDKKRTAGMIKSFAKFGQLFLTTAVEPPPALAEGSARFRIIEGKIEATN